jgi:hypothetical protein
VANKDNLVCKKCDVANLLKFVDIIEIDQKDENFNEFADGYMIEFTNSHISYPQLINLVTVDDVLQNKARKKHHPERRLSHFVRLN